MDNIIIAIRQPVEHMPPIINLIDICLAENKNVTLISSNTSGEFADKYKAGVDFVDIPQKSTRSRIMKIISWIKYRYAFFKYAEKNKELFDNAILWIGSADTAIALGGKLFRYNYVFQCHELYDTVPFYRKRLGRIMNRAIVNVTPNPDRGAIFRMWYNLPETPVTLPNKPFIHPGGRRLPVADKVAAEIIEKLQDKKIVLYMGGITPRRDLTPMAKAISRLGDKWALVLMGSARGSEDYLNKILNLCPGSVHIPPVKAPLHLEVASWAHIGIVSYDFVELNHVFCAPNKTWEYTGFGVPLLGNDIPGVMNDIRYFHSGEAVNFESNIEEIVNALIRIDENYDTYSSNALRFFNSKNTLSIVRTILLKHKHVKKLPER